MLPELGASYGVPSSAAAVSVTAYLLPFAALQVVSGTLGERWGRRRTVRIAYVVYTAASLLCALAPTFALFLAARALQGVANAFTTPLLFAALASSVAPERLGRALGWFGSLQAAGQTSAPLIGGAAAEIDWRWAFVGVGGGERAAGARRDPGDGGTPRPATGAADGVATRRAARRRGGGRRMGLRVRAELPGGATPRRHRSGSPRAHAAWC